ncbi:hypothetical protein SMD44_00931 [Streptomyces alboflavus]|uniref:Uncharacterized protein n=1 Tax=Streptomyces alboflavus TaxID=67267 RepID=A0A1Z1W512_9ACTN|nr:hypothetical protein SMD44_00931 [Streptomyces alboflavus]
MATAVCRHRKALQWRSELGQLTDSSIGYFDDDIARIERAIAYLRRGTAGSIAEAA